MDGPHKKNATYADIEALPEGKTGELIDGDLYICGRPRSQHARALGRMLGQLDVDDDDDPSGWVVLAEVEIWFVKKRTLLVPDMSAWRRSRMPEMPKVSTFNLIPDWVCEGLSPSTARIDRGRKLEIYAKHGVGHVWYVDPESQMIEVLRLEGRSYVHHKVVGGDSKVTLPPFEHRLDLSKLWKR